MRKSQQRELADLFPQKIGWIRGTHGLGMSNTSSASIPQSHFPFSPLSPPPPPLPGYPFFGNITVTRACEEECLSYNGIGASKPKSCCYTDLCTDDTKSSSGVRSSSAALVLVAMVAGAIFQCSL